MILFVESIRLFGRILISSEAKRSAFIFSLSILWYVQKETVALFWDLGVKKFGMKLNEKKRISVVDNGNIVIVGFG